MDAPDGDGAGTDGPPRPPQYSSCMGLQMLCGSSGAASCCDPAMTIPGGTFYRGYDDSPDAYNSVNAPATVSSFVLDKYEVTVGRFRAFVNMGLGTKAKPPAAGAGAHPNLPGSGWDSGWNANLVADTTAFRAAVKCSATYETWTDAPGANDNKPMNCVTWHEAMAFCVWDGGYLPTEAEWNYAAAGGSEQRSYPWSNPASSIAIDCSYANYFVNNPAGTFCVNGTTGAVNRVGSESPKGDGKWGQSDLGGNLEEWVFDGYDANYLIPCNDCAVPPNNGGWTRGGRFGSSPADVRTGYRVNYASSDRSSGIGFRCARAP